MVVSLIAALADNRVIGIENRLPWHIPEDMKWFRRHTLGKPIVMGRRTFESIGRPLPGRTNVVVTRDPRFDAVGCRVAGDIDEALRSLADHEEVMVIGGQSLYEQTLPLAGRLYLTLVHASVEGDAYFPPFDWNAWREVAREEHAATGDSAAFSFLILERRATNMSGTD